MKRQNRTRGAWLVCWIVLTIAGLVFGTGIKAMADIAIYLQEDGGGYTEAFHAASFNLGGGQGSISGTTTFGDYQLLTVGATAANGSLSSNLLSGVITLRSLTAGKHTLDILATETDYTLPIGPILSVDSRMAGTSGVELTFLGTATFQAFADQNNGLGPAGMPGTFTTGLQTAALSGSSFDTGDAFGSFTTLATDYSVTSVAEFTTTGIGDMNISTHVTLSAVPEPATMLLLGSGLLGMGVYARRRFRK